MNRYLFFHAPVVAAALLGLSGAACAGVTQTSTVVAPITAVAIGPSRAAVEVNVIRASLVGAGGRTVIVRAPLTAVSYPGFNVTLRVR